MKCEQWSFHISQGKSKWKGVKMEEDGNKYKETKREHNTWSG